MATIPAHQTLNFYDMVRGSDWSMVWRLVQDRALTAVELSGCTSVLQVYDDDDTVIWSGAGTIDTDDGSITGSVPASGSSGLDSQVLMYKTALNWSDGVSTTVFKGFIYTD